MPKTPHILNAAGNCQKMKVNLASILDARGIAAIDKEIQRNVLGLLDLGLEHLAFAERLSAVDWRQKISRTYYGAYNMVRAVKLFHDGHYSTEVADHKRIDEFPNDFPNRNTYTSRLGALREDRNLADYDHTATEADLVSTVPDTVSLVADLRRDTETYFRSKGII